MNALWRGRRLLVVVGSGGVGKTTVSAALALAAARAGLRTLVLTIDPARRLADALGLDALPGRPAAVPSPALAAAGLDVGDRLSAMMLDQAGAWDRLLARHAEPAARARLEASRFYRILSRRFAGATAYLAIDELTALAGDGDHDLIVLDTAPGDHAVELFDAPARARALLDRRVLRWLPIGAAGRAGTTGGYLARRLAAATGADALADVAAVLATTSDLASVLSTRAAAARAVLTDRTTGVIVVASPTTVATRAAADLATRIARHGVDVAGAVVNRVARGWPGPVGPGAVAGALIEVGLAGHADWVARAFVDHERRAAVHAARVAELAAALPPGLPVATIDAQPDDVHDLRGLAAMAGALGDGPGAWRDRPGGGRLASQVS